MTTMTSDRKLAANQKNAKKSTGPKSNGGKHRSARNTLSHGLSIPVSGIAAMRGDIDDLALSIARAWGGDAITLRSRQAAEAQVEIVRIRKVRAEILASEISYDELNNRLTRLERYERRAFSR